MNNKKNSNLNKKKADKEQAYQSLVQVAKDNGYLVRREKLKTGPGWRVISGTCRVESSKMIFVDSQLPQEDQIEFLSSKIRELGLVVESSSGLSAY